MITIDKALIYCYNQSVLCTSPIILLTLIDKYIRYNKSKHPYLFT